VPLLVVGLRRLFAEKNKQPAQLWQVGLLIVWLVVPIVLAWLVSFVVPVLQPKRVLFCLPALYLVASYFICDFLPQKVNKKNPLSWLSVLALTLLLGINLIFTFQYYVSPKYQREDWRGTHELLISTFPYRQSVAVFAFSEPFAPWRWYDNGEYPVVTTGVLSTSKTDDLSTLKKVTEYKNVLLFDYLRDLTDPQHKVEQQLKSYGYEEMQQITPRTELGVIHVYQRQGKYANR